MDTIALDTTAIHSNGVIWIPWHWIPIDPPLEARLGEATHAPGAGVRASVVASGFSADQRPEKGSESPACARVFAAR